MLFHCNAGKGRTGTAICCTFLYCGLFTKTEDALKYYAIKRFVDGIGGVTQPCQIRYVKYFQKLLENQIKSAPPKVFKQMIINSFPGVLGDVIDSNATMEFYQYHFENLVI